MTDTPSIPPALTADCLHCFHGDGYGTSTAMYGCGNSGGESGKCCRCGERMYRTWREQKEPVAGHGPHVTQCVRVYDAPVLAAEFRPK